MEKMEKLELPEVLGPNRQHIEDWIAYKKEKRQGYRPMGLKALLTVLSRWDPGELAEAIENSMANKGMGIHHKKVEPNPADQRQAAIKRTQDAEARLKKERIAAGMCTVCGGKIQIYDGVKRCSACLVSYG